MTNMEVFHVQQEKMRELLSMTSDVKKVIAMEAQQQMELEALGLTGD